MLALRPRRLARRRVLLGGTTGLMTCAGLPSARADTPTVASEWAAFRKRFLKSDGRIVDTGNGGISHSEGQGWGMLFAQAANDRDSFDLIHAWTAAHLARPNDALHIWRYDPAAANPVADPNNATDGDIFIAWALARGARLWGKPAFAEAAAAIARDIRDRLCIIQSGYLFLLPGISGFAGTNSVNLNLSYYVLPAFDTLAALAPSDKWARLRHDGLFLMRQAVFGSWSLPPDWINVSGPPLAFTPAAAWPPRFGYEAIRIPLWLSWANAMPASLGASFMNYWQSPKLPYHPAWVDLRTGAYAPYAAPTGMQAVADFTLASLNHATPSFPMVADAPDYYSAALILLSRMGYLECLSA